MLIKEEETLREKTTNFEDLEFQALEICSKLDESHQDQEQILMKEKKLVQDCINMRKVIQIYTKHLYRFTKVLITKTM